MLSPNMETQPLEGGNSFRKNSLFKMCYYYLLLILILWCWGWNQYSSLHYIPTAKIFNLRVPEEGCTCVHMSSRPASGVVLQVPLPCFLRRGLSLAWSSWGRQSWLAGKPHGSSGTTRKILLWPAVYYMGSEDRTRVLTPAL